MALGFALALLAGCGKPVGLTETVVAAESVEGLAAFRAEIASPAAAHARTALPESALSRGSVPDRLLLI